MQFGVFLGKEPVSLSDRPADLTELVKMLSTIFCNDVVVLAN